MNLRELLSVRTSQNVLADKDQPEKKGALSAALAFAWPNARIRGVNYSQRRLSTRGASCDLSVEVRLGVAEAFASVKLRDYRIAPCTGGAVTHDRNAAGHSDGLDAPARELMGAATHDFLIANGPQ